MAEQVLTFGAPETGRVSAKVKAAIDGIIFEALPRAEACARAKISLHGLYKSMRKAPTMAYYRSCLEVLRTGAGAAAVAKVERLMNDAQSEHVQLGAAQWLAGLEGIAPVQRGEFHHMHHHKVPGLVIIRTPHPAQDEVSDPSSAVTIDQQPSWPVNRIGQSVSHPRAARINVIGTPRPHPSQVKQEAGDGD